MTHWHLKVVKDTSRTPAERRAWRAYQQTPAYRADCERRRQEIQASWDVATELKRRAYDGWRPQPVEWPECDWPTEVIGDEDDWQDLPEES